MGIETNRRIYRRPIQRKVTIDNRSWKGTVCATRNKVIALASTISNQTQFQRYPVIVIKLREFGDKVSVCAQKSIKRLRFEADGNKRV